MAPFLLCAERLAYLAVLVAAGLAAGRLRLFSDPAGAVGALNVFALRFGFPALVFVGIVDARFALPREPAFWLFVPASQLGFVALMRAGLAKMGHGEQAGTVALTTLFGNVAYLGIPLASALFPPELGGVLALAVSLHVVVAVAAGPVLLHAWSGEDAPEGQARAVLRHPLLWAPVAGLVARELPGSARDVVLEATRPLALAAPPVALFLLGLYLFIQRRAVRGRVPGAAGHVFVRLFLAPAWAGVLVHLLVRASWLDVAHARIFVLLAAMPAAITTFSIAHEAGIGQERVAAVVVRSSVLSAGTLPAVFAALAWL